MNITERLIVRLLYLPDSDIVITPNLVSFDSVELDMDRMPYGVGSITLGNITPTLLAALDPRRPASRRLQYRIQRQDPSQPDDGISANFTGTLLIRRLTEDVVAGTVTLDLATPEVKLTEMIRLAGTTLDTACTTLLALVQYALNTVGVSLANYIDNASLSAISIPAGDRRLWQPGESAWDLIESELNAAGVRLYAALDGQTFLTEKRVNPPAGSAGSLIASTSTTTADLAVTSLTRTYDRADWADGVLARYTYVNSSGATVTAYQASGTSGYKGLVVDYQRAPSSTNLANGIRTRTLTRGASYELTTNLQSSAVPGAALSLDRPGQARLSLGMIRMARWNFTTGEMTIRTEIGAPT